jgi:hypothetical protein
METRHVYTLAQRGRSWRVLTVTSGLVEYGISDLREAPQNNKMQLTSHG